MIAFTVTLVLGSLTEFIINGLFATKTPQLAPIMTVIPIGVFYYTLRRYGFMTTAAAGPYSDALGNLSGATRSRLYLYLGNGYFLAGFFSFATNYLTGRESFAATIIFGGLMFVFGFLLLVVQFSTIRRQTRERLSALVLATSILVTTAQFAASDPITGWMFPVLTILVAVLLGDRNLLTMVGLATFVGIVVMLFRQPEASLTFTLGDHLIRLLVMGIALGFGFFINRVFNQMILENQEKTGQEKLLSQINGLFLKVSEQNLRRKMNAMLQLCGEQFEAKHMLLVFHHQDGPNEGYQWFSNPQHKKNRQDALRDYFEFRKPAELSAFMNQQLVCYSHSQTSIESRFEEFRQSIGIESFMIQPLSDGDREPIGFLIFSRFDRDKTCRPSQQDFLMILSHTLVDIVNKLAVEKVITYQANYDGVTGLMNPIVLYRRAATALAG